MKMFFEILKLFVSWKIIKIQYIISIGIFLDNDIDSIETDIQILSNFLAKFPNHSLIELNIRLSLIFTVWLELRPKILLRIEV